MSDRVAILKATLVISAGTFVAKSFGFINNLVIAYFLGQGAETDAYFAAIIIPTLVIGIFIAALENSIIPTYIEISDDQSKRSFVGSLLVLSLLVLLGITILFIALRPIIIPYSTYGFDLNRQSLVLSLTLIVFWSIFFQGVSGIAISLLNANKKFALTSITGVIIPITMIMAMTAGDGRVTLLPIGLVIGAFLQSILLIAVLYKQLKPKLSFSWHPAITKTLHNFKYLIAGMLMVQLNPLVDQIMVSGQPAGALSAIQYAWKIMDIPIVLIVMAGSRALLPYIAKDAANNLNDLKKNLSFQIWLIGPLMILVSILLIVFSKSIVSFMFQRGQFGLDDTVMTAGALFYYAIGLLPIALGVLIPRAFNALQKNSTLAKVTIFSVTANIVFNYIFINMFGYRGIALSTTAVSFCSVLILGAILVKEIGPEWLYPPEQIRQFLLRNQRPERSLADRPGVCMVIFNMYPGNMAGTELQALMLAQKLEEKGFTAFFLTPKREKSFESEMYKGIKIIRFPVFRLFGKYRLGRLFFWLAALSMAYKLFKLRSKFRVIHVHILSNLAFVASIMGKLLRKPVIVKVAASDIMTDLDFLRQKPSGKLFERTLKYLQPAIIATSSKAQKKMADEGFKKIYNISNGVNTLRWSPHSYSNSKQVIKIVSVGRLVSDKAYDVLLNSYGMLRKEGLPFKAKIIGDGPLRNELEQQIKVLDLQDNVELCGHIEDVPKVLLEARLFILSSRCEGMPNALLESMATGLPCIATRISGCEDIIKDNYNGLLVDSENPEQIAKSVTDLYNDYDRAITLGKNARQTVIENYSIDSVVEKYIELYDTLCRQRLYMANEGPTVEPSINAGIGTLEQDK